MDDNVNFCERNFFPISEFIYLFIYLFIYFILRLVYFSFSFTDSLWNNTGIP